MTTSLNTSTAPVSKDGETISDKREWIKSVLLKNDAVIVFTKKDGSERKMKCTLREGIAIPYEKKTERTREGSVEILPVWDLEANGWRSINVSTLKTLEFIAEI